MAGSKLSNIYATSRSDVPLRQPKLRKRAQRSRAVERASVAEPVDVVNEHMDMDDVDYGVGDDGYWPEELPPGEASAPVETAGAIDPAFEDVSLSDPGVSESDTSESTCSDTESSVSSIGGRSSASNNSMGVHEPLHVVWNDHVRFDEDDPGEGPGEEADDAQALSPSAKTNLAIAIWVSTNQLSRRLYSQLREILLLPDFDPSQLPVSKKALLKSMASLKLTRVVQRPVNVKVRSTKTWKGPTTKTAISFQYDLADFCEKRILRNPDLFRQLHQGLGIKLAKRYEVWHGQLWWQSIASSRQDYPLRAQDGAWIWPGSIVEYQQAQRRYFGRISGIFRQGDKDGAITAHVQPIKTRAELILFLQSGPHAAQWAELLATYEEGIGFPAGPYFLLVDEEQEVLIEDIMTTSELKISRRKSDSTDQINENWPASEQQLGFAQSSCLPFTRAELELANGVVSMEELEQEDSNHTIVLHLSHYYDKFGAFRTAHHAIGGFYIMPADLPFRVRDEMRNHFIYGYTPYGANFYDAFEHSLRQLARHAVVPFEVDLKGRKYDIYLDMTYARFDMPEANSMAGCLSPNAICGCRFCLVTKASLGDMLMSPVELFKSHRQAGAMESIRAEAIEQPTDKACKEQLTRYGLAEKSSPYIRTGVLVDPHSQFPVDVSHANSSGLVKDRFLIPLVEHVLSPAAVDAISKAMARGKAGGFPMPKSYSSVRSIGHAGSYTQHEAVAMISILPLVLTIIMPSVRNRGIRPKALTIKAQGSDVVLREVVAVAVLIHRHVWLSLQREFTQQMYADLDLTARQCRIALAALLEPFGLDYALPNMHTALHMADSARAVGNLLNASVSIDESVHRLPKGLMSKTNKRDTGSTFIREDNIGQALRLIKTSKELDVDQTARFILDLEAVCPTLLSGYYHDNNIVEVDNEQILDKSVLEGVTIVSIPDRFNNIRLVSEMTKKEVKAANFVDDIGKSHAEVGTMRQILQFRDSLIQAYSAFYDRNAVLLTGNLGRIKCFKKIVMYDNLLHRRVTITTGDFTLINRTDEVGTPCSVRAIFAHKWASRYHVFLSVDWMCKTPNQPTNLGPVERYRFEPFAPLGHVVALGTVSSQPPPHVVPTQLDHAVLPANVRQFYLNRGLVRLI